MTTMTQAVTTLRAGDLVACRWCGIGIPEGDGARWFAGMFGPPGNERPAGLGVCPGCAETNDRAVQIAEGLPADERAALGDYPALRISELLRAVAVLGTEEPALWEPASYYLHQTGAVRLLEWALQYNEDGLASRQDSCAFAPFSWVSPRRVRAALDAAEAEAEAVGQPHMVRLPPPAGGGCAFCGLDGIDADAQAVYRAGGVQKAARDAWRTKRQGKQRWVCPSCAAVGGVSPAQTARLAATDAAGLTAAVEQAGAVRLPAVPPWFSTGASPSAEPWAHVGGVAAVRQAIRDAITPPPPPPTVEDVAERVDELTARVARLERLLADR